jgi:hypothetical protein
MITVEYFNYLLELVGIDFSKYYTHLLNILFMINFRWSIHNDDNRALDGIDIRYNYGQEMGVSERSLQELTLVPCSVMEVICGLAIRMDEIMRDPERRHIDRWFWEMIDNLGLIDFTDDAFERGQWNLQNVEEKVDIFMDRTYDELGHGGLFPRNHCDKNQKEVELFAQMNGYLNENYC